MHSAAPDSWVTVTVERTDSPTAEALLNASHAAMLEVYPPDALLAPSAEEMRAPNIQFLVARQGGLPLGCAVLHDELTYGVIRRVYVAPEARGLGVASGLMLEIERLAGDLGLGTLRVETGPDLDAAVALYRKLGYVPCPAFGPYDDTPSNLFLEKRLR